MEIGIEIYTQILLGALPIGLAFAICDFIVVTYLNMILRGKIKIGG